MCSLRKVTEKLLAVVSAQRRWSFCRNRLPYTVFPRTLFSGTSTCVATAVFPTLDSAWESSDALPGCAVLSTCVRRYHSRACSIGFDLNCGFSDLFGYHRL